MSKPTIKKGPASAYAGPHETIVEVWSRKLHKGCLIAVRELDDGTLMIDGYRCDPGVIVNGTQGPQ